MTELNLTPAKRNCDGQPSLAPATCSAHEATPDEACGTCKYCSVWPTDEPCRSCCHMDFENLENQRSNFEPNDES